MSTLKIIAVTACISGVSHTYMAAERLSKLAQQENWSIKIETQGALGIDSIITPTDCLSADLVIIISNVNIKEKERFNGLRCVEMDISQFLLDSTPLLAVIKRIAKAPIGTYAKIPA